jgi:hypothetical protein
VYPKPCPTEPYIFFKFLQTHIQLESNGMGVGIRESRADIARLLDKEGFDYSMTQDFVDEFESKLYNQYNKEREKEQK